MRENNLRNKGKRRNKMERSAKRRSALAVEGLETRTMLTAQPVLY
jgi:hypothetical protein